MLIPSSSLPLLKGRFPFRLGTTSYILPDAIVPNVLFLGPLLDEVELVLFESGREDNLPTTREIEELAILAGEQKLTYNVHLPTDVLLGHPEAAIRQRACATIMRFYERTMPLQPTMYCLHLENNTPGETAPPQIADWLTNLLYSLEDLLAAGMRRSLIGIENINYTFPWIYPLIRELDLNICLDIGHLLFQHEELETYLSLYGDKTIMLHLHGVEGQRDHRSLQGISDANWQIIAAFLRDYRGGVSIEVFSQDDLARSLQRMEDIL
ncbi:MAG TPA: hypothetical protein DCG53_06230 [Syntrophus sp. (in: bacteria)]|jgi:sugar phosphate isomerase/epimerase|nr:hypothetical protein [Syntrophus sp. (in: bacteria)]